MKDTYRFKKSSKTRFHVQEVLEKYGSKATFKHRGLTWRIVDIKSDNEHELLMYLEI